MPGGMPAMIYFNALPTVITLTTTTEGRAQRGRAKGRARVMGESVCPFAAENYAVLGRSAVQYSTIVGRRNG